MSGRWRSWPFAPTFTASGIEGASAGFRHFPASRSRGIGAALPSVRNLTARGPAIRVAVAEGKRNHGGSEADLGVDRANRGLDDHPAGGRDRREQRLDARRRPARIIERPRTASITLDLTRVNAVDARGL